MESFLVIRRSELLMHTMTWMNQKHAEDIYVRHKKCILRSPISMKP